MVAASTVLGAAGEHYVMSVLLRHGFIAALAPVGVPNTDIIVSDDIGDRLCAVQVKTRVEKGSDGGWHMSEKHEKIISTGLFYVFLDFGRTLTDQPVSYVVPSAVVADVVARSHAMWLSQQVKGCRCARTARCAGSCRISRKSAWISGPGRAGWSPIVRPGVPLKERPEGQLYVICKSRITVDGRAILTRSKTMA